MSLWELTKTGLGAVSDLSKTGLGAVSDLSKSGLGAVSDLSKVGLELGIDTVKGSVPDLMPAQANGIRVQESDEIAEQVQKNSMHVPSWISALSYWVVCNAECGCNAQRVARW